MPPDLLGPLAVAPVRADVVPPEVYGPAGALVVLAIVAYVLGRVIQSLWEDHKRSDAYVLTQLDRSTTGWESQTNATNRLAEALEGLSRELSKPPDKREP